MIDINKTLRESAECIDRICEDAALCNTIQTVIAVIVNSIKLGNKLLICGNGGSAADAQHISAEFLCRFKKDRRPLPAIALSTDTSTLTAISNDYEFKKVFSRQIDALAKPGDVLIGISTSGKSPNVLDALEAANRVGAHMILLTGIYGGAKCPDGTIIVAVPSDNTARIQEALLLIEHIICEGVECGLI